MKHKPRTTATTTYCPNCRQPTKHDITTTRTLVRRECRACGRMEEKARTFGQLTGGEVAMADCYYTCGGHGYQTLCVHASITEWTGHSITYECAKYGGLLGKGHRSGLTRLPECEGPEEFHLACGCEGNLKRDDQGNLKREATP